MEGNLNRARSTLGTRPSSSMSSFNNARNNEPASLYSLSNQSAKHRQTGSLDDSKANHSTTFSDAPNKESSPKEDGLGISNMEGSGSDSGRQWFWNGLTRTTSLAQRERYNTLEPLHEDGPPPEKFHRQSPAILEEQDDDAAMDQGFEDLQKASNPFADFDSANPPATGLTRARSTTQMRDIRDQMQDLKGKISTLKQRARQDSLYRRSLQNLRTPSPFTAAEQWYTGVPLHEERTASVSPQPKVSPRMKSPARLSPQSAIDQTNGHLKSDEEGRDLDSGVDIHEQGRPETTILTITPPEAKSVTEQNDIPKVSVEQATASEDSLPELPPADAEEAASLRDVEDSLDGDEDQYHETSALPLGERHEDRPDAFDYEHFFLHSGMGHHKSGASRSSSRSSLSSVETTKPEGYDADAALVNSSVSSKKGHIRKDSVESTASFTTAPSDEKSNTDEDILIPRNVVIAPPRSDSLKHRKANGADGHQTRDPKRERSSRGSKRGTRPPSNSLSSTHPAVVGQRQQENEDLPSSPSPLLGYLARISPEPGRGEVKLGDRDAELAERLFSSLARVCADLEAIDIEEEGESKYKARMYRRKLDAARRVLDGEVNGEAF